MEAIFAQIATCLQSHNLRMLSIGFLDQGDQLYVLTPLPNEAIAPIRELITKIRAGEMEVNRSYDDNNHKLYSVVVERGFNTSMEVMTNGLTFQLHDRPTRSVFLD